MFTVMKVLKVTVRVLWYTSFVSFWPVKNIAELAHGLFCTVKGPAADATDAP
jgi:hypothetical protein